jgi:hypothetical protein
LGLDVVRKVGHALEYNSDPTLTSPQEERQVLRMLFVAAFPHSHGALEIAAATSLSVVASTAKDKCATASCSSVAIVEALADDGA